MQLADPIRTPHRRQPHRRQPQGYFRANWLIPTLLFAFGALSVAGGAFQLFTISKGIPPNVAPKDFDALQYVQRPFPILLHILPGILFNLLTPLQFAPAIRRRWPRLHRWSGRMLVVCGILAGATAMWMNHFFNPFGGTLKYVGIHLFGLGLIGSLLVSLWAIRRRNFRMHRAWMMRAMAFGLGGATQRVFLLPMFIYFGGLSDLQIGLGIWFGFMLNVLIVEWVLMRERGRMSIAQTA